jgi:hypothetical protein
VGPALREVLRIVVEMLRGFETGKTGDGDSWEALFVVATMARLATGHFHRLLQLEPGLFSNCELSYNRMWKATEENLDFPSIRTLEQLMKGLTEPASYPHVAVFYPPHSQFEVYDLVIVAHEAVDVKHVYGYQLREGRKIPQTTPSDVCQHSFVIRGCAAQKERLLRKWHVASDEEVDQFLGVTGASLAPKQWRQFTE